MRSRFLVAASIGLVAALATGALLARVWLGQSTASQALSTHPIAPSPTAAANTSRFVTLPPGKPLPSDAQCAASVRIDPPPENKRPNQQSNQVTGQPVGNFFPTADAADANRWIAPRIDGQFTGTTAQILRWTACKWGIDEELVAAQAAVESWWRQSATGDWGTDPAACPPGHGLGADGVAGRCPQSYGILQNRYSVEKSSWPGIANSTAMNADTAYGIWRACYEGYEVWLNHVQRVGNYGPGDAWGCIGRWFAGRWHTAAAERYIARVRDYLNRRVWLQADFQEP